MATAGEHTNLLSTVPPPVRSSAFTRLSGKPYELHEAVFRGDQETVDVLLREASDVCNVVDCHGMSCFIFSPLSIHVFASLPFLQETLHSI